MKKINFLTCLLITVILFSCGETKSNCEFSHLTITTAIDGKEVDQKTGNDCYSIIKEGDGELAIFTVGGKQTSDKFSMTYYDENSKVDLKNGQGTVLKFLNVNLGRKKTEWRANKGHHIYKVEKQDTLGFFISGEDSKKSISLSISVLFTK